MIVLIKVGLMAAYFFHQQLDYIFFLYGFAFILLAAVCLIMHRERIGRLPWIWLGLFGFVHGLIEWLEMFAFSLGDGTVYSVIRLGLMTVSFVLLFEFGRSGLLRLRGKGPGRWIYVPLLVLAGSGSITGLSGLNAAVRYTFGLSGALLSVLSLLYASRMEDISTRHIFFSAAALMGGFALASGGIVPEASFFPASVINQASFLSFTGVPIQLIRGILVVLISTAFWWYYLRFRESGLPPGIHGNRTRHGLQFASLTVCVLTFGWILTQLVGKDVEQDARNDIMNQTRVAAASLDPERVRRLAAVAFDATHTDYIRLKEQLRDMKSGNPGFRWLYLMSLDKGKTAHVVVSSPQDKYGHASPGKRVYEQAREELLKVFTSGQAAVVGPYADEYGTLFTGFAPVGDPVSRRTNGVLGLDINARYLQTKIAKHRVPPIVVTLLVCMLCVGFFLTRQRLWETSRRIAVSERILTEAQRIAHMGSWTYDPGTDVLTWSEEMFNIFGLDRQEGVPSMAAQQQFIHEEDREKLDEAFQQAIREGQPFELEFRVLRPAGTRFVVLKVDTVIDDSGVQILGICQDITERKQAEEQLRELSLLDELTGLHNRRGFLVLATQQIKIADRMKQKAILVFADMDNLKQVNDTLGHKEGDQALIDIANILKGALRASDIIARWGGDEFVGLTLESVENAGEVVLSRLQENVAAHNRRGERAHTLSISFGVTFYDPERPCALEELLERGDKQMYEQKQKRKIQQMA